MGDEFEETGVDTFSDADTGSDWSDSGDSFDDSSMDVGDEPIEDCASEGLDDNTTEDAGESFDSSFAEAEDEPVSDFGAEESGRSLDSNEAFTDAEEPVDASSESSDENLEALPDSDDIATDSDTPSVESDASADSEAACDGDVADWSETGAPSEGSDIPVDEDLEATDYDAQDLPESEESSERTDEAADSSADDLSEGSTETPDTPTGENADVADCSAEGLHDDAPTDGIDKPADAAAEGDSPEDAYQKLSQYMSDHNYGKDDYDTYSQDPEWQDLNRKAFPDQHEHNTDTNLSPSDLPPDNGTLRDEGASELPNRVDQSDIGISYDDAEKTKDFSPDAYEQQSKNDAKDLDYDQRKALEGYSNEDYRKINDGLRGKDVDYTTPEQQERLDSQANAISDALDNKTLPQDMTLYRGLNDPKCLFGEGYQDKSLDQLRKENIGTIFCDDGFCSTSIDRGTACDFANSWNGTVMDISAPEGASGMCMHDVSGHAGENEVLLQKGSCFRIDNVDYDRSSGYTVKASLVGRKS